MNSNRIGKLSNLVNNDLKRKPTIILDPNPDTSFRIFGTASDVTVGIDAYDRYCNDVLIQIAAISKSLQTLGNSILESYLKSYVAYEVHMGNLDILEDAIN